MRSGTALRAVSSGHTLGTDHVPYIREQWIDPEQHVRRHRVGSNNL